MAQYNQELPLVPAKSYPRSDEGSAVFPPPVIPKPVAARKRANKSFVCFLTMVVILSACGLVFALAVLRIEAPQFKLEKAAVRNLVYDNSTSSSRVRGTLVGEVILRNSNFGSFEHGNGTVSVLHGDEDFGVRKVIDQGRVKGRATETTMASVDFLVSGHGEGKNNSLSEDIGQGVMRLRSYGQVRGKVGVLGFMTKNKVAVMDCTISLDLFSGRIKDLFCK